MFKIFKVSRKLANQANSYVGLLSSIFLAENEYEVYGYYTATKIRFILFLSQKTNLATYDERNIKQVKKLYKSLKLKKLLLI